MKLIMPRVYLFIFLIVYFVKVESFSEISVGNINTFAAYNLFEGFQIETTLNITKCVRHSRYIIEGVLRRELWALKFLDSWGSLPSGILSNNLLSFGDFDQCLSISEEINDEQIRGQYCLSRIPIESILKQSGSEYIAIGICLPSSCDVIDIQSQLVEALEALEYSPVTRGPGVFNQDQCTLNSKESFQSGDILTVIILCLAVFLVALSTGYHYFLTSDSSELLTTFSLLKNVKSLFATETDDPPNQIEFLHGTFGVAIIFVIFDNSFNGDYMLNINHQQTPLIRTLLLMDIILLAEGFALVQLVTRKFAAKRYFLTIPKLLFHKYHRLTIVFGLTILFSSTLFKHIGNGPLWKTEVANFRPCQLYWWSALLHIQTYVNAEEMCFPDSWVLSVCMQLYVISLVILLPFHKWCLQSAFGVIVLIFMCMTASYFTLHEQQQYYTRVTSKGDFPVYGHLMYEIFHGAVAWLIGILLGYITLWSKQKKMTLSPCQIRIGWAITSFLVVSIIVFTKDHQQINNDQFTTEQIVNKLFTRFIWSLNISWIILICSQGNCDPLKNFLSSKFWRLFSQLRYGIYSIQILINAFMRGTMKSSVHHHSYIEKMQNSLGNLIITVAVSFCVSLTIEFPLLNLEDIFWKRFHLYFNRNTYDVERQTVSAITDVF